MKREILEKARIHEESGDLVRALMVYREAYVGDSNDEDAIQGIAQCALSLENLELAFEFFVKLLIQNHENPWGYIGRANVLFHYGQTDRALSDLAQAIRLDNPATALRIDIAAVLNANGYCGAALDVLSPICQSHFEETDFKCEWCFAMLAENRLESQELIQILDYFERHLDDDPFYELCLLAYEIKRDCAAEGKLTEFLAIYPEFEPEAAGLNLLAG